MAVFLKVPQIQGKNRPTLFLDRDGVLIVDRHYLALPQDVALIPGVCDALRQAKSAGFILVGVSNQSGLGRGLFTQNDFQLVMARMNELMAAEGVILDGFYYCPHGPNDHCGCRKPLPGLLDEAEAHFNWDPDRSWVIGDKLSDVKLGRDHKMGGILVETGHGLAAKAQVQEKYSNDSRVGIASDLQEAIELILGTMGPGEGKS